VPRRPGAPPPLPYAHLRIPTVHTEGTGALDRGRVKVRSGEWLRVRAGAFVETAELEADPHLRARQLLLARIAAVVAQSGPTTVVSHASAAALWGLPLDRLPEWVEVVKPVRRAGCAAPDVVRRVRATHPTEVVERRGLPTTSLARTVVDCARTLGSRGALVIADAALAAGLSRRECSALLAGLTGARGIRVARQVMALADEGAESAGESLLRWAVLAAGFPPPETQIAVDTHLGRFWADVGWPEWRLVAEYDGAGKYEDAPGDVVRAEKRRQDAITEEGWRVVRVTSADLRDPWALARRFLRLVPREVAVRLSPRQALAEHPLARAPRR